AVPRRPSRQVAGLLAEHLELRPEEREDFIRCARAELGADRLPPPPQSAPRAAFVPATQAVAPGTQPFSQLALPSGTVTFLFTDIEASTALWQRHAKAMPAALARHEAILRQAIETRGGVVFKTVGDAVCAAVATAPQALAAAPDAQRALNADSWDTLASPEPPHPPTQNPKSPLAVRMALHTGTAELRAGDYAGLALSRVARILAAGHG